MGQLNNDENYSGKAKNSKPARIAGRFSKISRCIVTLSMCFLLILAILPAQSQNSPGGPGVSTYIVVFNGSAGVSSAAVAKNTMADFVSTHGGHVKYNYNVINGMAITIPDSEAGRLNSLPNVKYVEKDGVVHAQLNQAVPQIGANQVWALGYNGSGIKVSVVDTGIDGNNPDLNNGKVVAWADFVYGNNATPYDDYGHGTHVAGIIAGTGNASGGLYKGVAPGASLMGAKVLDSSGNGYISTIIEGINWSVQNHAQVISMSLGSAQHFQSMDDAVNGAVSQGIVVVIAAGNNGPTGHIPHVLCCPGDAEDAITVGAVDSTDVIAGFSSRGPTWDGRQKPDVSAPGVNIISDKANGNPSTGYYTTMSGTSMATPMVSGIIALMLQRNASLTPTQVKNILKQTALPLKVNATDPIPNYDYGYGRVQAKYAIDNVTPSVNPVGILPRTVWSDMGKIGSVSGRVVNAANTGIGVASAYVAIVNATNTSQVYYATTSDPNGYYYFLGINATYSSALGQGPHGGTGPDYILGQSMYMVIAKKSQYGDGNSTAFGIDTNHSGWTTTQVAVYPPVSDYCKYGARTVWSDQYKNGTITGRVTSSTNSSFGISGAYVALVNASNASQEYCNTTSNSSGYYSLSYVNATYSSTLGLGPHGLGGADYTLGTSMYKIRASKSPYSDGYSSPFGVNTNASAASVSVAIYPPVSDYCKYGARTVWSDQYKSGSITGRVTTSVNETVGVASAYIALVNASNVSQEYCNTTSDAYGNYNMSYINATYSSILGRGPDGTTGSLWLGEHMYKMYANKSPYGEGWSEAFGIDTNNSLPTTTSVVIIPKPARIELWASKPYVATNSTDNITITAYMYDAMGNPVSDGYYVNFTVGNATNNSFTRGSFPWTVANGSLGSRGNGISSDNPTRDNLGRAAVNFGWVDKAYSGNNSTVWAYYADDPKVNASIKIYFDQAKYNFTLKHGWNIISVPFIPNVTNVTDFFPPGAMDDIEVIWMYNTSSTSPWSYYTPRTDIYEQGSLTSIDEKHGYYVYCNNDTSFQSSGIPVNESIPLGNGWNLIGNPTMANRTPWDTYNNFEVIWEYNSSNSNPWSYYTPRTDIYEQGTLTSLKPGYGYMIYK